MWCLEVLLTLPTFERTGRTIDKRDARWAGAPAEFSRFVSEPPADDDRGGWNGRVCRERAFWCSKASARSSASFKSPFCLRHRRSSPGEAPMGGCSIFLWLGTAIFEMYAKSQLKPAAGRNCDDMSVWPGDVGKGSQMGPTTKPGPRNRDTEIAVVSSNCAITNLPLAALIARWS